MVVPATWFVLVEKYSVEICVKRRSSLSHTLSSLSLSLCLCLSVSLSFSLSVSLSLSVCVCVCVCLKRKQGGDVPGIQMHCRRHTSWRQTALRHSPRAPAPKRPCPCPSAELHSARHQVPLFHSPAQPMSMTLAACEGLRLDRCGGCGSASHLISPISLFKQNVTDASRHT